ncbi:hypothetical protein ABZ468_10495 [Streptomyces sp. NPDC005708]|uniref:hypothetical protein n=1 Tax=unclassified Streptomyces TaxID=2593676 RepID=UPI00340D18F7
MDPATLVTQAPASGASACLTTATSSAVRDAHGALRSACLQRLPERYRELYATEAADSSTRLPEPVRELIATGGVDARLVELARRLPALTDPAGTRSGTSRADLRQARGVQVGDHNIQHNSFG